MTLLGRLFRRREPPLELGEGPRCVAIIMDGNSRWAAAKGMTVEEGHRAGTRALRPPAEVDSLMEIFAETIRRELPDLAEQGVRTRFIGRRDRVSAGLRRQMEDLEDETSSRDRLDLWIAFDYGGRAELAAAAQRIVDARRAPEEIDEEVFAAHLYARDLPEPDLLIRTSGELRISNFLLWQLAYAELVFTERLWPDFGEEDLRAAVRDYAGRKRRFGAR